MSTRRTTKLRITEDFAAPPEEVFSLCVSRAGFENAMPPGVRVLAWPEHFVDGAVLDFRWAVAGLELVRWTAVVEDFDDGRAFTDHQVQGPFRFWRHTHVCEPHGDGTRYTDMVEFSTGYGPPGDLVVATMIRLAFGPRLRRMRADLATEHP